MEVCTAEKQMERRTGCLQANIEFLQQALAKLAREAQDKIATAGRDLVAARAEMANSNLQWRRSVASWRKSKRKPRPTTTKKLSPAAPSKRQASALLRRVQYLRALRATIPILALPGPAPPFLRKS